MSVTLRTAAPCATCGQLLPTGKRVDRSRDQRGGVVHTHNDRVIGLCRPVAAQQTTSDPSELLATDRQVAFALDLMRTAWTPAVLGGRKPVACDLRQMRRSEISQVIDALLDERRLSED